MTWLNPMLTSSMKGGAKKCGAMKGGAVNFEFNPMNYAAENAGQLAGYGCRGESNGPLATSGHAFQKGGNAYYSLAGSPSLPLGPNSGYGKLEYFSDTGNSSKPQFPSQLRQSGGGRKTKRRRSSYTQIGCNRKSHKHRGFHRHKKSIRRRSRRHGGAKSTKKVLPRSLRRHLGLRSRSKSMRGGGGTMNYSDFPTTKYTFSPGQVSDPSLIGLANPSPIAAIKGCETLNR